MGRTFLLLLLLSALVTTSASAEDLSYITDDELTEELAARKDDLKRTTERLEDLRHQQVALHAEVERIGERIEAIDSRLVQRTSMLYRLSRNGKTVQYLFTSESAITFLKRIQTLRKLITSEMDEKREANLELTRKKDEVTQIQTEIANAAGLIEELHLAIDDLRIEQQRRGTEAMLAQS